MAQRVKDLALSLPWTGSVSGWENSTCLRYTSLFPPPPRRLKDYLFVSFFLFFFFFVFSRATPRAYGGSQARSPNGALADDLCHSHSNAKSRLCL